MKKYLILMSLFLIVHSIVYSQVPDQLNYQAAIRNNDGDLIVNQSVKVRVSIINEAMDGNELYTEHHSITTNSFGLVNFIIGNGAAESGSFADINWGEKKKFLGISIDVGTGYVPMGTVQLLAVPYALYANDVANKDDADANPSNEIQDIDLTGNNLTITSGSTVDLSVLQDGVDDADNNPLNEIQDIDLIGTDLSITSGSTVDLSVLQDGVDDADNNPLNEIQDIDLTGNNLTITSGSTVDLSILQDGVDDADNNPLNEIQDIDLIGTDLSITSGSTVDLSVLQDGVDDADNNPLNEIQDIDLTGNNLTITSGSTVDLSILQDGVDDADNNPLNEIQELEITGDTLKISNGNQVVFPYDSSYWVANGDKLYYNTGNVGIGSSNPVSKLEVKATVTSGALFQVINADNDTVFAVYPDGVKVFADSEAEGKIGGFAVSGRSPSSAGEIEILRVTADNTRIFVNDSVAGFGIANTESGIAENFLNLNKQNYLIGHQAGRNTTGIYNSMIGYKAGYTNSIGSNNIFFGYKAGYLNYTGGNNVFIGSESGFRNQFAFQNTYVGYRSGYDLSGSGNTVMGSMAGENAGGGNNTFIGTEAGRVATGGNNTFLGYSAGSSDPNENSGIRNTYIGEAVGSFTSTGSYNVMLGFNSGYLNYEGSRNTFLGYDAGHNIHEGSGNIFIGHNAGYYADGINNRLIIDNEDIDSTDVLIYGEFDQNHLRINGNIGVNYQAYNSYGLIVDIPDGQTSIYTLLIYGDAWASGGSWNTSDERYKKNITTYENALNTIMQFRGVSYDWRVDEFPQQRFTEKRQLGFIAQEVEKIVPDLVKEGPDGFKGLEYNKFTPIIVEAIKEQQTQIEQLKSENDELRKQLSEIMKMLEEK